jgi:hypothetical protein
MSRLSAVKKLLGIREVEDTAAILARMSKPNEEAQDRALKSFDYAEGVQHETLEAAENLSAAARNIRHVSASMLMRMRAHRMQKQ